MPTIGKPLMMGSNYGDGLRSGSSSPSFEWNIEGNSRDGTFEPVPLFDTNSDESVGESRARTQQYESVEPPSGELRGEKRSATDTVTMNNCLDGMPISRRKKKQKGMPKRAQSAYALFFSRERSKLIESDGDPNSPGNKRLSFEELEKIIGMRWKNLTTDERKEFEGLASEDSVRYRNEMESFNGEKKKQKAERSLPQPEPPMNDPPPMLPPPHASMQQRSYYMPPPSPSSSGAPPVPPMYGHPSQHSLSPRHATGRHRHPPHHPEQHYPPLPFPPPIPALSVQQRFHHEAPPPHSYYPPPPVVSSSRSQQPPPPVMRTSSSSLHSHSASPTATSMDRDLFPIPPGMELMLPDRDGRERKYRVQYATYIMTREAARDYVDRLSSAISHGGTPPPPPPPSQTRRADADSDLGASARPPAWSGNY